jgi:glycine betaine/choline ABC-type transport system substrate-binding protein
MDNIEVKGKLININHDFITDKFTIILEVDNSNGVKKFYSKVKDKLLRISLKVHREKRSKDSNSYAWVLMQKLAEATQTDKMAVYEELLKRYSRAFDTVLIKPDAIESFTRMYRTYIDHGEVTFNGTTGHQISVFYGSSMFNTKEMELFINGLIAECKEHDIETLTPADIELMNSKWNSKKII